MKNTLNSTRHLILIGTLLIFIAVPAFSCGSMPGIGGFIVLTGIVVAFGPIMLMFALIPVELAILRRIGQLDTRTYWAYGYCLLAKVAGLLAVSQQLVDRKALNIWQNEAIYSGTHFAVVVVGLTMVFKINFSRAALTATLTSTLIPWTLSLGTVLYFKWRGGI